METQVKLNTVLKAIYERRAVRKYKDQPVEKDVIELIIDAGRMAPSALNRQPWKFYVLDDKRSIHLFSKAIAKAAAKGFMRSGIKGIGKVLKESVHLAHGIDFLIAPDPVFHGAPVVIFLTAPKENEWAQLDLGMCAQNMMLAAKALGLESCPIGFGKFVEETELFPLLHIPDGEEVQLALVFGYGDEEPETHSRNKDNVIYIPGI